MSNAFKEKVARVLGGSDKTLARGVDLDVGPVDEEKLWVNMVRQVVTCMKNGGFYCRIEETLPPLSDVMFGTHCEVVVRDEQENCYEVGLRSFHYPGDKGESQTLQIDEKGVYDYILVAVHFRSNVNRISLSPDSEVRKHRSISSYPRELNSNEKLDLLNRLSRVIVDERKTWELFDERRQRDGRSVAWIRDMSLLPNILGGNGGL